MNTTSVSVNKNIPDNSKIDVKAKSSKGEDNFKDMIRNASLKKASGYNEKAVDKPKASNQSQGDDDTQEKAEGVSDVSLFLMPQGGVIDPVQLVKIIQVPTENLGLAEPKLADPQVSGVQATAKATAAEVLQGAVVAVPVAEKSGIITEPLIQSTQSLQEEPGQEKSNPLSHQDGERNTVIQNPQKSDDLQKALPPEEKGTENILSKGEEETEVHGAEPRPIHNEDVQEAKVTIKVGDTALKSSWEQVAKEIGDMVVEKVNNEIQKISVKLNPKDLGEINVEFSMDNGKISVSLNCSNEGTKSLLALNLDTLSRVVQSSLMQETNVTINYEKTDGQSPNNENFDGRGQGQYQGDENGRRKEQEQADLDFAQKLRLGIETLDDMEG